MTTTAELRERWTALLDRRGLHDRDAVLDALLAAYGDPSRGYHGLDHLREVLDRIDALEPAASAYARDHRASADGTAVRLAAWFHDAVYDGRRGDNEERSAQWAEASIGDLGASTELASEAGRLIRLTAGHAVAEGDANGAWLCDADLLILAGPSAQYEHYVAGVRAEYAHVPDEQWRAGRRAVLEGLIAGGGLFTLCPEREPDARRNIERELRRL